MSKPTQPCDEYFIRVNYPESELGSDTIRVRFPYNGVDDTQWHYERAKEVAKRLQTIVLVACAHGSCDRGEALIQAVDCFNQSQEAPVCKADIVFTVASVDVPEPNDPE